MIYFIERTNKIDKIDITYGEEEIFFSMTKLKLLRLFRPITKFSVKRKDNYF
jgi:hypothetical protein